jgi:hypothetical protein
MDRTYIIEPTLILRTGHVKKCTELFALESSKYHEKTIVVVPIGAPEILSTNSKIKVLKILPNTYERLLYDEKLFRSSIRNSIEVLFFFLRKNKKNKLVFFCERLFWYLQNSKKMKIALQQLFDIEKIDSQDRVILPNGDLMCTNSIIRVVQRLGKNSSPRLAIRFINVMENAGIPKLFSKKTMLRKLRSLERENYNLRITAETENYRLFLARYLANSGICEYPEVFKVKTSKNSNEIVIGVLGSARPDKGFEELRQIIPMLKSSNFRNSISFIIQGSTTSWGTKYDETLNMLRQFSSTKILPGYISEQEMDEAISSCTALLLPYDVGTYAFRGSAMLFDASDLNIPIIAPSGTGMGTTIRRFGIGATYSSFTEIPSAISFVSQLNSEEIGKRFAIYNNFRSSSLRKFLE